MAEYVYELFAAVVHRGDTAVAGHYYALIKDEQDVWYTFDDEDVTLMVVHAGAAAGTAAEQPSKTYLGASGHAPGRCYDHIVRLPEKGTNRKLRARFAPFQPGERAARAGVALVFGADATNWSKFAPGIEETE